MEPPPEPKIYHIVHIDNLLSIIVDGYLWSDAITTRSAKPRLNIGYDHIKKRRREELQLSSHPGLFVSACVPFYFSPRPVMLYPIHMRNPALGYTGGQKPIVHLEADLLRTREWATERNRRLAFTTSSAATYHFNDYSDLGQLDRIDWDAVNAIDFRGRSDAKQAEFLVEDYFPWCLVERIGVHNPGIAQDVTRIIGSSTHRPRVEVKKGWYY